MGLEINNFFFVFRQRIEANNVRKMYEDFPQNTGKRLDLGYGVFEVFQKAKAQKIFG